MLPPRPTIEDAAWRSEAGTPNTHQGPPRPSVQDAAWRSEAATPNTQRSLSARASTGSVCRVRVSPCCVVVLLSLYCCVVVVGGVSYSVMAEADQMPLTALRVAEREDAACLFPRLHYRLLTLCPAAY